MTYEDFSKLFDERVSKLIETGAIKGKKYTEGSGDRLFNFKKEALEANLTPLQIWSVYFGKHLSAIRYYLRSGENIGEDICDTHIHDCIMYLFLLEGLIREQNPKEQSPNIRDTYSKFKGTCYYCGAIFENKDELDSHVVKNHMETK